MKLQFSLKSKCNGAKSLGVKGGRPLREVGVSSVCGMVRADFPRHFKASPFFGGAFFLPKNARSSSTLNTDRPTAALLGSYALSAPAAG